MTATTQSDQILGLVAAQVATKYLMMNLQVPGAATDLTPPIVSAQDNIASLARFLAIIESKPTLHLPLPVLIVLESPPVIAQRDGLRLARATLGHRSPGGRQ